MKILQVMASCSRSSGVAQVVMNYYRQINKDINFDFLMFWDVEESFKQEIISYGGEVYFTEAPTIKTLHQYIRWMQAFFKQHAAEYDAIHLHELYMNSIIFSIAKKYGIKVLIAHSHATKLSENRLRSIRNYFMFFSVRFLATNFFACSHAAGVSAFGKRIVNGKKFILIRNAIDVGKYEYSTYARTKIRKTFNLEDAPVVGHIGRFSPSKNHFFLLDIFYELQKKRSDMKMLLVGEGELFEKVKKKAEELGIDNKIVFAGVRKDIGDLLSAMDVFVFPSFFEGLGNVLIEAQSNGLSCIVSDSVPQEAEILSNYRKIGLKENISVWVNVVLEQLGDRVENATESMKEVCYEINAASERLLEVYKEIISFD